MLLCARYNGQAPFGYSDRNPTTTSLSKRTAKKKWGNILDHIHIIGKMKLVFKKRMDPEVIVLLFKLSLPLPLVSP